MFSGIPKYLRNLKGLVSTPAQIDATIRKTILRSRKQFNLFNTPVVNKATIASSISPVLTGLTNIVPASNGYEFSLSVNTTTNNETITVTSTVGLVPGHEIFENTPSNRVPIAIPLGSKIVSIDSATQVTINKKCISTASVSMLVMHKGINLIGGILGGYNGYFTATSTTVDKNNAALGFVPYAIEFYTDASMFDISSHSLVFYVHQNGTSPFSYKIAIDDVYQNSTPQGYSGNYLTITFNEAKIHKVRLECQNSFLIRGIYLKNGANVWKTESKTKALFFGDSYFMLGESGTWGMSNIANRTAEQLGWEIFNCSVGGTGYVHNGGSNYPWSNELRLNDSLKKDSNIIILFGSINDSSYTDLERKTAYNIVWSGLRARHPNKPIIVFGIPTTISLIQANASSQELNMKTTFLEWGDKNSYFVPITTDPKGAWLNSNNLSKYISADTSHLNDKGQEYFSSLMTNKIEEIIEMME